MAKLTFTMNFLQYGQVEMSYSINMLSIQIDSENLLYCYLALDFDYRGIFLICSQSLDGRKRIFNGNSFIF